MVWDILVHIAALDIAWLYFTAMGNLLWIFIFLTISFFFFNGKNIARSFVHVTFAALFMGSLLPFIGWEEFGGHFLLLYYLLDLAILSAAEANKFLSSRLVWVEEFVFFGLLIGYNVFLR